MSDGEIRRSGQAARRDRDPTQSETSSYQIDRVAVSQSHVPIGISESFVNLSLDVYHPYALSCVIPQLVQTASHLSHIDRLTSGRLSDHLSIFCQIDDEAIFFCNWCLPIRIGATIGKAVNQLLTNNCNIPSHSAFDNSISRIVHILVLVLSHILLFIPSCLNSSGFSSQFLHPPAFNTKSARVDARLSRNDSHHRHLEWARFVRSRQQCELHSMEWIGAYSLVDAISPSTDWRRRTSQTRNEITEKGWDGEEQDQEFVRGKGRIGNLS